MKKINVTFCVCDYYDDFGNIYIPVSKITPAQLYQLQENIANAQIPADACPTSFSAKYEEHMSFLNGGMRCNRLAEHNRELEISDIFYLRPKAPHTKCGISTKKIEEKLTAHCARNLRAGKCQDAFMRATIGAVLFPQFYSKDKQK